MVPPSYVRDERRSHSRMTLCCREVLETVSWPKLRRKRRKCSQIALRAPILDRQLCLTPGGTVGTYSCRNVLDLAGHWGPGYQASSLILTSYHSSSNCDARKEVA